MRTKPLICWLVAFVICPITGFFGAQAIAAYYAPPDMGAPATVAPPAVGDNSLQGSSAQWARADHTHRSSVQRVVLPTQSDGTVNWTFPVAYDQAPSVQVTVETTSGQPYVPLVTGRTTTGVTIKVLRAQTLPASLTLLSALVSFNIFGGTVPAGVNVHIWAAKFQ